MRPLGPARCSHRETNPVSSRCDQPATAGCQSDDGARASPRAASFVEAVLMVRKVPAKHTVWTVGQAHKKGIVFERHSGVDNRTPIGSAAARRAPMGMGRPASVRPAPFFARSPRPEHQSTVALERAYLLKASYTPDSPRNVNAIHFPASRFGMMEPRGRVMLRTRRRREAVMGTFAQKNGRPPGASQGRPTCDAAYERVAREFLRQFALDRDEGFAAAVANRFKEAPAKVCCRAIGGWIDERLLAFGWTQHDLADRIGVDRSAVAKWTAGGAISLGHLVLVLLEFGGDFGELPLPARRELALEGYLAALSHVRARIDPAGGREPLDRERFWCLYPSAFRAVLGAGDPAAGPRSSSRRKQTGFSRAPASRSGPRPGVSSGSRACDAWSRSGPRRG